MSRLTLTLVVLSLGAGAVAQHNLAAQNDPRLAAAVRLAQEGLSDSARAVVARILATMQPDDSLYAEALYTSGLLAKTEQDRRLALRRVLVDYGQSSWADDALLQLAQLDYAGGNAAATVRQIEQLLRDYPGSPLLAVAAFWGARAAGDRRDAATACRLADQGLAAVGNDVELGNQLEFQKQRCQGIAAMAAESTRVALADSLAKARSDSIARAERRHPTSRRSGGQAVGRSDYYVQISAVPTQATANGDVARAKRAGYSAIVMKEGRYFKVRAGPFRSRTEAETAVAALRAKLGVRPFLVRVAAP